MRTRAAFVIGAALTIAACSGGGDDATDDTPDPTDPPATTRPAEDDVRSATTTPPTTAAPTTTTTTTTTVPPEPYPAGVVWDGPIEVTSERAGLYGQSGGGFGTRGGFRRVGQELWVLAQAGDEPLVARSLDGGATWSTVTIAPELNGGRVVVDHVVQRADGAYVAVGERGSNCELVGFPTPFLQCADGQPVVFTSADASSWTEVSPTAWAPAGGNDLEIDSIVATDDGLIAAGTYVGPQWRSVLFSSPDGVEWTREREMTSGEPYLSSEQLVYDGATLTFLAGATTCARPDRINGIWFLSTGNTERHGRIFTGTDIASLTLQNPGDHPLAPEPLVPASPPPGCEGLINGFPYTFHPYPEFFGLLADGTTAIIEQYIPPDQLRAIDEAQGDESIDLEEVEGRSGTRRYAQLVDGTWQLTEIQGVPIRDRFAFEFEDTVTFGRLLGEGLGDGPFQTVEVYSTSEVIGSERGPVVDGILDMTAVGDTMLALGIDPTDRFAPTDRETPARLVVWRSTAGAGETGPTCDLVPNGVCRQFDLTEHPDYPDFSGRDLSGVDLAGSRLAQASFDGANLSGAQLWLTTGSDDGWPTFIDADLSGAALQEAELGDISGADVTEANLRNAVVRDGRDVDFSAAAVLEDVLILDAVGSTFAGADMSGANITVDERFVDLPSLTFDRLTIQVEPSTGVTPEVALSGLNLTGLSLEGPGQFGDNEGVLLVVTSLDGAIIDDTDVSDVDLSSIDPSIDLTNLNVTGDSICPDGLPPDSESVISGTCVRGITE